jgi:hypothetical protein
MKIKGFLWQAKKKTGASGTAADISRGSRAGKGSALRPAALMSASFKFLPANEKTRRVAPGS